MKTSNQLHTAPEESIAAYVAGMLSPAKSLVLACQASMSAEVAARLRETELVAGSLLESANGAELSTGFTQKLMDALDLEPDAETEAPTTIPASQNDWVPAPLCQFMSDANIALNWRFAGPGVARAPLVEYENGERLYLLKAVNGFVMPSHSHRGEEWTLILKGAYRADDQSYSSGDLHCEDETSTHQPIIDESDECICLVAIEGKLRFRQPLLRLLQPVLGV